jgi:hypothetical protein
MATGNGPNLVKVFLAADRAFDKRDINVGRKFLGVDLGESAGW